MNVGYVRVSTSSQNLENQIDQLKGVDLKELHQNIDTTSPAGRLMFTMLGAIAEFERDLVD